ncbi:uncharacterized protein LOC141623297 [Silene latifolia]|uniref:uncharacterized protein LOC141623297 n=1 Tax=Silene latifolia TaxID=37657 RepID=UPI003D775308
MVEVIKEIGVPSYQLMPMVWKVVCSVEYLCKKHNISFSLDDLKTNYAVKTNSPGRISFKVRASTTAFLSNLDSGHDKNWAAGYMFIRTNFVGPDLAYLNYEACVAVDDWVTEIEYPTANIYAFLAIPPLERSWPLCCGAGHLPRCLKADGTARVPKPSKAVSASTSATRSSTRLARFGMADLKIKEEGSQGGGDAEPVIDLTDLPDAS